MDAIYLSIAPYWNWNVLIGMRIPRIDILSIAPYWNWNMFGIWLNSFWNSSQSHHTGIEIKIPSFFQSQLHHSQSHHTGIEIGYLVPTTLASKISQSHHTGIEISVKLVQVRVTWGSQSHHTGIEILSLEALWSLPITLNRTILELKFLKAIFLNLL